MVTLGMALEDMKLQLVEGVQSAIVLGFELVAGVVGDKLAKSAQLAVKKNAEVVGNLKAGGGGGGGGLEEIAGLREQIRDNASILLPLLNARNRFPTPVCRASNRAASPTTTIPDAGHPINNIRVVTVGSKSDGIRALVVEQSASAAGKPHMHMWSHKHDSPVVALQDLLGVTQAQLRMYTNQLMDPPTPVVEQDATFAATAAAPSQKQTQPRTTTTATWNHRPAMPMFETAYPSFNLDSPIDSTAADVGNASFASASFKTSSSSSGTKPTSVKTKSPLFWDAEMITNPSFGGFDYGSFSSDGTVEDSSDGDTRVDPVGGSFW